MPECAETQYSKQAIKTLLRSIFASFFVRAPLIIGFRNMRMKIPHLYQKRKFCLFFTTIAALSIAAILPSTASSTADPALHPPDARDPQAPLSQKAQEHHLVDLAQLPDPPLLDIRYATRLNFTGQKLYPLPAAWLHEDAAAALLRVQARLREAGLGLRVLDAYRPFAVQELMWDLIQDERYVSNPAVNRGRHTRGTAADVTLTDLMGNPLPMPSGFDDFSERAHRDYSGATAEQKKNSQILEDAMVAEGFDPLPTEWWHFDLRDWQKYPVLDISLSDLAVGVQRTFPVPEAPLPGSPQP